MKQTIAFSCSVYVKLNLIKKRIEDQEKKLQENQKLIAYLLKISDLQTCNLDK